MRNFRMPLVAAGLLTFAFSNALANDVKVIANSSVKADIISARDLKRVFLEENNSLADGSHVEPVLEKDGPAHQAFLQKYVGRTADDLQTYYRGLAFSGRGSMPKELGSDAEVVAYVAKTRGAIGYVSAETRTEGVKTLAIVSAGNGDAQRKLILRIEPEYPDTLKRLNIGGTVRLQVSIAAKGNVENVELLGGNPILGQAAISAVKQWLYAASHSRTVVQISIPFDSQP
jgi:TonB family protein